MAATDEFDPGFLTEMVALIYEAAVDPARWDDFVGQLERIYADSRITLFAHENGQHTAALRVHRNFPAEALRDYVEYFARISPYIARGSILAVGQPTHYEVMIDDRELETTAYYNEFSRPYGLGHYGTGLVVDRHAGRSAALSLADHHDDAERRARQLRLLQILAPHLTRAFRLSRTVQAQQLNGHAARAALDCWVHAALVLDSGGTVVVMNRAAELLLQGADGLWLGRDGKLRSVDEARTRALEDAIRNCATLDVSDGAGGDLDAIVLPRLSGAPPLRAMISPLRSPGGNAGYDLGSGTVLVVLFDPGNVRRAPVDWMARQFGLTPSEQRLAEAIINGVPLTEAAEQLGILLSTARTRLKIIQAKTNCHRQVDLVRLALSLPAMRQG